MSFGHTAYRSVCFQVDPATYARIEKTAKEAGMTVRRFAKAAVVLRVTAPRKGKR
jgi:hypothetical protein